MFKSGSFLACINVNSKEKILKLQDIMPIGKIVVEGEEAKVFVSVDGKEFIEVKSGNANGRTALYLKVISKGKSCVRFFVGNGFWAKRDEKLTEKFLRYSGWTGGDGINSFNLNGGNDGWNAGNENTLLVFGDSFVSNIDENGKRIKPVYMPNNTCAIMKGKDNIEFICKEENGKPEALLKPKLGDGSWFWLQDGVVIKDYLYLTPMVMSEDLTQREGFQFKIENVSMIKIPILNGKPEFEKAEETDTNLFVRSDGKMWLSGIAYMPFCKEFGYENGDGYIYAYGYINTSDTDSNCRLIVARAKPENFEDTNTWEFFDGNNFVSDITKSAELLEHISCEMSVTPITHGAFKDKFIAVFQYDVQSEYLAYAIGETPHGPFGEIQKVYWCDEVQRIHESVYTYNSKAHPHISKEGELLVSYNVNTPIMEVNYDFADIYRPRFLRLVDTTFDINNRE